MDKLTISNEVDYKLPELWYVIDFWPKRYARTIFDPKKSADHPYHLDPYHSPKAEESKE